MTKDEALRMALEALEEVVKWYQVRDKHDEPMPVHNQNPEIKAAIEAITAIKEALAQPQQEPVAWLITDEKINSLQVESIQRLIDRLKHAHHTDLCVRINGHDEWFEADWLKHMVRVTPPQRTWVGLTNGDWNSTPYDTEFRAGAEWAEAKLKEKNT